MIVSSKYLYTFTMGQKRDKNIHRLFTRYEMVSLSLHETNPGHHLQGSYSIEQADWPMFRKVIILTTLMALCSFWENCGLFPCLIFSTDHGGQNIQPSALQVPHQHWLCRGETPLWNAPTVASVINSCWKVFQGWALYSEGLGYDIDMYGNPLDRYKTDTSPKQWEVEVPFFQFWPPERRDLPRLPPRRWHGDARARLD